MPIQLGAVPGPYKLEVKGIRGVGAIQDYLNEKYREGYDFVGKVHDGTTDWWVFKKRQ